MLKPPYIPGVEWCVASMETEFSWKERNDVEQTNEEWLKQASTEELAWLLYEIAVYDTLNDRIRNAEVVEPSTDGTSGFEEVIRWLKEKHNV